MQSHSLPRFANFVYRVAVFGFAALLTLALIFHQDYLRTSRHWIAYFALPVAILGVAFLSRRTWQSRLLFTWGIFSLFLGLVFLEWLLATQRLQTWLSLGTPSAQAVARRQGVPFDPRSKLEVFRDLRASGRQVYPNFYSSLYLGQKKILPLGGIPNVETILCNENGQYIIYRSDEWGFRNPPGALKGPLDLLVIGDSFGQGSCVQDDQTFDGQFRKHGFKVASLSMGNSGSLLRLANFLEFGEQLKPKRVLWFYFANDLTDHHEESESVILQAYLKKGELQNLVQRQSEMAHLHEEQLQAALKQVQATVVAPTTVSPALDWKKILRLYELRGFLGLGRTEDFRQKQNEPIPESRIEKALEGLEQSLLRAKNTAKSWGGEIVFIYLPDYWNPKGRVIEYGDTYRDRVVAIPQKLGLQVIDLYPAFHSHPDHLSLFPFGVSGHYNPKGYAFATDEIVKQLGK